MELNYLAKFLFCYLAKFLLVMARETLSLATKHLCWGFGVQRCLMSSESNGKEGNRYLSYIMLHLFYGLELLFPTQVLRR